MAALPTAANAFVLACYQGEGGDGIHLLGALARKVIRIAPPLVITEQEVRDSMDLMYRAAARLAGATAPARAAVAVG